MNVGGLCGFDDTDFYKAKEIPTSDTQLYKQAGNSIVVNVLEEILKKLLKEESKCYKVFYKEKYKSI